jgi:hypothetical protein
MTLTLAGSLIGIALIDSFNPSLFFGQFLLFATHRPVPRLIAYLLGLLTVNYLGGVAFVAGMRALVGDVVASIAPTTGALILLALGVGAFAFGVWYRPKPADMNAGARVPLNLAMAYGFGMVVMVQELTTAMPLVVAAERIAAAEMGWGWNLAALALYNLIFAGPLFAFVGAFVFLRERFTVHLDRISAWISVWGPKMGKYFALWGGLALAVYAGYRLLVLAAG